MRLVPLWMPLCSALAVAAPTPARAAAGEAAVADSSRRAAPALPPERVRAWQTGLLRPDRMQHASLSLTLALAAGLLTREPAAGAGFGIGLGVAKELYDMRHGHFDVIDLLADAIGTGIGTVGAAAIED